jgi:hypothetical protein
LVVGAVIGPTAQGRISGYEPLTLKPTADGMTGLARTPVGTERIREVGIHVHMANPEAWSPEGSTVTLRVEPAPEANPLPWSPDVTEQARRS